MPEDSAGEAERDMHVETRYINDPAWEHERYRLSLLEELHDPWSFERLEEIGIGEGSSALEIGAGSGSVAAWLARRIGLGGQVVATDIDTRFLDELDEPGLQVLRHDVLADDFPCESFELVHCRALLIHLAERERALERMVRWLKPGGVLVAEEPWSDATLLARSHDDGGFAQMFKRAAPHIDGSFARRLPMALRRVGLTDVRTKAQLRFYDGGTKEAEFYRLSLEAPLRLLTEAGALSESESERFKRRYDDPNFSDCGFPVISSWGRKPRRCGEAPP